MGNFLRKNYIKLLSILGVLLLTVIGVTVIKGGLKKTYANTNPRLLQYTQYQDGDELIDGTEYVTFDAYFYENLNGTPTKIRGEYLNINESADLWLDLHVFGDVQLKDAKIFLQNNNTKTSGYLYSSSIIPSNMMVPDGGNIVLQPTIAGSTFNNTITITSKITNNLNSLSNSTNKVILTGTVVKPNGDEVSIVKEVSYTVDWYLDDLVSNIGKFGFKQSFPYREVYGCPGQTLVGNIAAYYHVWTEENYKLSFYVTTTANNPFLKSANIELKFLI